MKQDSVWRAAEDLPGQVPAQVGRGVRRGGCEGEGKSGAVLAAHGIRQGAQQDRSRPRRPGFLLVRRGAVPEEPQV